MKTSQDLFYRIKNRWIRPDTDTNNISAIDISSDHPSIKGLTPEKRILLQNETFYCGQLESKGPNCCFNHNIGLPTKQGVEKELFDYEYPDLYHVFEQHKLIWILKSRGLGITEFSLRYMIWKALTGEPAQYKNSQIAIIVGPKLDIAKDLIGRIRIMFINKLGISFDTRSEEVTLPINNVTIRAYPSNHIDSFRGQPNVSLILVDEGDFFLRQQQKQVRDTIEPYNTKSNSQVIFVSTPNMPDGLMQTIEKESNDYTKLRLDYTIGLDKIYEIDEIETALRRGYFEREYNLKYEGLVGNAFHQSDIEAAITEVYNPFDANNTSTFYGRCMGIDEGFGSSNFAIVITQGRDHVAEVIYAQEFDRPLSSDIIQLIIQLKNKHHITRIFVDASNSGFVKELKQKIGDSDFETYSQNECIVKHLTDYLVRHNSMRITPVNFGTCHRDLLFHVHELLAARKVRIHPTFTNLITSLRTAQVEENWSLDKEASAFNDTLDAFRLSLLTYSLRGHT